MDKKKYRVLIVDDEPLARKGLRIRLEEDKDLEILGEAKNGKEACEKITQLSPDIVLLDIQMPGLDGVEVAQRLNGDNPPAIIFVTAFNHYAIEAFEVNAVDYILKPLDAERLTEALSRAKARLTTKQQIFNCISDLSSTQDTLCLQDGKQIFRLSINNILWIESDDDYICVHSTDGEKTIRSTLKAVLNQKNNDLLVRIHRSKVINKSHICSIKKLKNNEFDIELNGGAVHRSGRTYADSIEQLMKAITE